MQKFEIRRFPRIPQEQKVVLTNAEETRIIAYLIEDIKDDVPDMKTLAILLQFATGCRPCESVYATHGSFTKAGEAGYVLKIPESMTKTRMAYRWVLPEDQNWCWQHLPKNEFVLEESDILCQYAKINRTWHTVLEALDISSTKTLKSIRKSVATKIWLDVLTKKASAAAANGLQHSNSRVTTACYVVRDGAEIDLSDMA